MDLIDPFKFFVFLCWSIGVGIERKPRSLELLFTDSSTQSGDVMKRRFKQTKPVK